MSSRSNWVSRTCEHPDGYTIGIVDVPGHEKLVKTMISGASGFQIALWVVDAREGLMPQSLEHLDVLKLLRVPKIIPVVTKAGLATDQEIRETVRCCPAIGRRAASQIVDSISKSGIRFVEGGALRGVPRPRSLIDLEVERRRTCRSIGASC